jgi:hypothetical protein
MGHVRRESPAIESRSPHAVGKGYARRPRIQSALSSEVFAMEPNFRYSIDREMMSRSDRIGNVRGFGDRLTVNADVRCCALNPGAARRTALPPAWGEPGSISVDRARKCLSPFDVIWHVRGRSCIRESRSVTSFDCLGPFSARRFSASAAIVPRRASWTSETLLRNRFFI